MANKTNNFGTDGNKPVSFENRFWSLFESGELSDVTLIVGEQKERIKSHKLVLAAPSPVFKNYFTDGEIKNELVISTVEPQVLRPFLKFVYTGENFFEVKNLIPLLNTAKYFQVEKLVTVCENMLINRLTEESVLMIFQQAIQYGEKDLEEFAKKIVLRNAHKIMETDEFLKMSEESLVKFLGEDELTVKSEVQIFDAMIGWAKAECKRQRVVATSKYCRSYLERLIPLIRFPQMDEGDFALKVAHGEIQILTQEELLSVYFYHKIPTERRSKISPGVFNSRPRRYIDNARFKIHVKTSNGENVTLIATPSNTILSVKERIQQNVGIPSNQQSLTFRGDVLQDEQTLLDCNILKESNLEYRDISGQKIEPQKSTNEGHDRIKIYIINKIGFPLRMEIEPKMFVKDVKTRIQEMTGIEACKQRLTFSGLQLENDTTLSEYGVLEGSDVHLDDPQNPVQCQNV